MLRWLNGSQRANRIAAVISLARDVCLGRFQMKITVIKKATNAKPMMSCPIIIDDAALAKR
jgi:hypothetical protein